MKRFSYNSVDRYYNQHSVLNAPLCVFRRAVLPGQTVNINGSMTVRSAAVAPNVSKVITSVFFFYVPYRTIWDQFVDFITDNGSVSPLSNRTEIPQLFETDSCSPLARRAYKLIYNQFFGDENSNEPLYDITDDTVLTLDKPVLNLEQRFRQLLPESQFATVNFEAPVSGSDATIELQRFSRSMADARRDFNFDKSGDKYVDFLRKMGANPDFNEQESAEFLGVRSVDIQGRIQASTDGATLGQMRSYFNAEMPVAVEKKRFGEHGIVLGLALTRPIVFNTRLGASDFRISTRNEFFDGNQVNIELASGDIDPLSADTYIVPPAYRYVAGQHVVNNNGNDDLVYTNNVTGAANQYTRFTMSPLEATLGTDSFSYLLDCKYWGQTPASTELTF